MSFIIPESFASDIELAHNDEDLPALRELAREFAGYIADDRRLGVDSERDESAQGHLRAHKAAIDAQGAIIARLSGDVDKAIRLEDAVDDFLAESGWF